MNPPSVSVVICTLGRRQRLEDCLAALSRQTLSSFEIIVILGPGAPETETFLWQQPDVQTLKTERRNLSASRNLGLEAARAPIVAYCDDDVIAEPGWLKHLVRPFEDPAVAGSGGKVLGTTDGEVGVTFNCGVVRLSGRQIDVCEQPGEYNDAGGPWYNRVCGCSCAFRRRALLQIGGFDEYIEFAYEETDVCVRLIHAGYSIVHVPNAVLMHLEAAGGYRHNALVRNWYCEIKNQAYFGLKNRTGLLSAARTCARVTARCLALGARFEFASRRALLTAQQRRQYRRDVCRALIRGTRDGLQAPRNRLPNRFARQSLGGTD